MKPLRRLAGTAACALAVLALPAAALAAPTATISAPPAGATWAAEEPIALAGSGSAADGSRLPPWSLRWVATLQSCTEVGGCSSRRIADFTGSSGTVTPPDRTSAAQLIVSLTATDSDGSTDTETVRLEARMSSLELRTSPPGFEVSLDDETQAAPLRRTLVVGSHVTIDAPEPQTLFGYDYAFGAWSEPFLKLATIAVPEADTTYEASFRATGRRTLLGADAVGDHVASGQPGQAVAYRALAARSGTVDRLRLYLDGDSAAGALGLGLYADAGGTPGALLGSGETASVTPGAWNEVGLDPQPKLAVGRTYWVGVLNPAGSGGVLRWRDQAGGSGGAGRTSRAQDLAALPAGWATESGFGDGPLSASALGPAPPAPDRGVDVEPGGLSFATSAGSSPPGQSIVVQANNGGCSPCAWRITDDAPWLSETPDSGDWPTRVDVSVDAADLAPGVYHATLTVGRGDDGDTTAVPVVVTVAAPSDGLVGAWSFDESSGATVSDNSGHGNDGTIEGAVRTSGGLAGGALAFDGDGDSVTIPDSESLDFGEGMTVEGWVRPNVLAGAGRALAVKEGDDGPAWGLFAADSSGLPSGHAVTGLDGVARGSAKVSLVPTWTHLATTYDGSLVRLYLNGRLVATAPQSGPLAGGPGTLQIGASARGEWFDGLMDEVRVYDRALSAGEVQLDLATPITPAG